MQEISQKGHASQKSRSMARYNIGIEKNPEEKEEKENSAGNRKQPVTNPIREGHVWEKEIAAKARLGKRGNLARYVTGLSDKPEEEEE